MTDSNGTPATLSYIGGSVSDTRTQRIKDAWSAYNGQLADPIRVEKGKPNDNIKTNHCKIAVDVIVSFLFGEPFMVQLDEDTQRTTEEKYLDDFLEYNDYVALFQKLVMNGSLSGHAFLKIKIEKPFPKIIVLDPLNVNVVTLPDDITTVTSYIITWKGAYKGKPAIYRQRIEHSHYGSEAGTQNLERVYALRSDGRYPFTDVQGEEINHWRIVDQVTTESTLEYRQDHANVSWETLAIDVWPYPFPPIIDCQNKPVPNAYWGAPDISEDVIALQKGINRALTNINKILRIHAHPKTWARGITSEQLLNVAMNPDSIIALPNPDAELLNLEMSADLASSITYYKELRSAFHELTTIPEIAIGKVENVGPLSGLAMKILYGSIIRSNKQKRVTYGGLVKKLTKAILFIKFGADERIRTYDELSLLTSLWNPEIIWQDELPEDEESDARTLALDLQFGVSKETALLKRGYNPQDEKTRRETETKDALKNAQEAADLMSRGQTQTDPFGRDTLNSRAQEGNTDG